MHKCKYCHTKFNTPEGLKAHQDSCFYAKNPLPEPIEEVIEEVKKPVKKAKKK